MGFPIKHPKIANNPELARALKAVDDAISKVSRESTLLDRSQTPEQVLEAYANDPHIYIFGLILSTPKNRNKCKHMYYLLAISKLI